MRTKELVEKLNLEPHPEGGYYRETYRSSGIIPQNGLGAHYSGSRNYCTGIYFLLTNKNFSAFHKINQDEMWHFYEGSPLRIHMIDTKGDYMYQDIGTNLHIDEVPQFTVPAGVWFASEVVKGGNYSLVGCTVSPGFDFDDFVLATNKKLNKLFPKHKDIINRLTRL
jgi:predicted cupin superfamily sugar epimerase